MVKNMVPGGLYTVYYFYSPATGTDHPCVHVHLWNWYQNDRTIMGAYTDMSKLYPIGTIDTTQELVLCLGSEMISMFYDNDKLQKREVLFYNVLVKDKMGYLMADHEFLEVNYNSRIEFGLISAPVLNEEKQLYVNNR